MVTILFAVISIAFIGLGIPDSLFGTAWPAIYRELNLPVSYANVVTATTSIGTILSSLFSAKLINKLGTGNVTAISTAMTAAALLGMSFSDNIIFFFILSIPLGLGAGAIDSGLNNYVAVNYTATHMNFLHCFYGVGVSLSPILMSFALSRTTWRTGYMIVFGLQFLIAIITIVSLPLWKKVNGNSSFHEDEQPKNIGFFELLKLPKIKLVCMVFLGSCALEFTCGVWGSTFLVNAKGFPAYKSALMVSFYYIGIALSRFLSGVLSIKLNSKQLIKIGISIVLVAMIWLIAPIPVNLSAVGLFLVGLGNGTIFPNMTHLTPEHFGVELSQQAMGIQMAVSYVGTLVAPFVFGLIAQNISINLFPPYLLILYLIMAVGYILLERSQKKI